uniref:Saposin B-type domain-containing protein n=1 Tax=Percolomonas cosmopolitus TaxID=63605 RepID=A0A7S1KPC7_9EUKA
MSHSSSRRHTLSLSFLLVCLIFLSFQTICASTEQIQLERTDPATELVDHQRTVAAPGVVSPVTTSLEQSTKAPNNSSLECTSCVIVITILEDFISSNTSLEYIIETASKICPYLDEDIRVVCPLMIREMTPEVIGAFLERENPVEVCSMMHLCEKPERRHGGSGMIPRGMSQEEFEEMNRKIEIARKEKILRK